MARLLKSFRHAIHGIAWALRTQANLRLHLLATVAVIIFGFIAGLPTWKWCGLVFAIGLVWTAELLNTALEALCDRLIPEKDDAVRHIKDVAAGAVLLASLAAAALASLLFF